MPGYYGGIWRGDQGPTPTQQVMVEASYGGTGGRVLQRNLPQGERRDAGGPAVAHHLQRSGGCSGPPLVIPDGGRGWG